MTPITFHFDVVSPFAYLAFEHLPEALEGVSHVVEYRPVLFAGLLKAHGHKGPAEIPPKREWTFRQVDWLAAKLGQGAMRCTHSTRLRCCACLWLAGRPGGCLTGVLWRF